MSSPGMMLVVDDGWGRKRGRLDQVRTDEATRIISRPALYLQHGRVLYSVRDPGHVDGVFIRDLDATVVVIREGGIGEVVIGGVDRGGGCGEGGCGGG